MKKINITTPENIEVEYTLADIPSRAAATFIDMLIIGAVCIVVGIITIVINNLATNFWYNYYGWILGITFFLLSAFYYGYFIVMELTTNGRTVGKKVMKLRTIRSNGQSVTFKHSAIRNLVRIFIDMTGVGPLIMFFSKEHKRLGDMMASTIVVIEKKGIEPNFIDTMNEEYIRFVKYLNSEEKDIFSEYLSLRNTYQTNNLGEKLQAHFTEKFEQLGILEEWQGYIARI